MTVKAPIEAHLRSGLQADALLGDAVQVWLRRGTEIPIPHDAAAVSDKIFARLEPLAVLDAPAKVEFHDGAATSEVIIPLLKTCAILDASAMVKFYDTASLQIILNDDADVM